MEKFIPYEKLSKKGSNPTAAGGGSREGSEWQRSARCKSALPDAASAGHRKPDHFFSPGKSTIAMQTQPNGCGCIAIFR